MSVARAISVAEATSKKFKELPFEGKFLDFIGKPTISGTWIIWGNSGNGKTRLALEIAKYLCNFTKVAYDTLEEGMSKTFQKAVIETGMDEVARRFTILDKEEITQLIERLSKRKSPDVIIIDSFQYSGITRDQYKHLQKQFPKKLFIFISHAEGTSPEGRTAKFVRYDADVKIHVEGYVATVVSRYGGGKPYTIWEQGATEYFNKK